MTYPLRGIRLRLAALFVGGVALLLAGGATALYLVLERAYRQDFDRRLLDSAEAARGLFAHDRAEYPSTEAAVAHIVTELVFGDRAVAAVGADGRRFAFGQSLPGTPALTATSPETHPLVPATVPLAGEPARMLYVPIADGVGIEFAMALAPLERELSRLRLILLAGVPAVLGIGGALGLLGARRALRPIEAVAASADRLGADALAGATTFTPLPDHHTGDEIARLTAAFNTLAARLGEALQRERTAAERHRAFLADAAHELRTPVAILQSQTEVALAAPLDPAGYRAALAEIAAEAENLGSIVHHLLLLARADGAGATAPRERVYLDDVVNAVFRRVRPLAGEGRLRRGEFEAAPALGNPDLLEQAVLVLVHNALVHAAPAPVEVSTGTETVAGLPHAVVRVVDHGPGIPPAMRDRVFDRFVRLDPARPGSGLGLPIARWIVESHGGRIGLAATPGGGATFTLEVPAA